MDETRSFFATTGETPLRKKLAALSAGGGAFCARRCERDSSLNADRRADLRDTTEVLDTHELPHAASLNHAVSRVWRASEWAGLDSN